MKRLLFITHRVPYPPDKGERIRAFHEIRELARHFRVTLATLSQGRPETSAAAELKPYCENILVAHAAKLHSWARGALGMLTGKSVTEGLYDCGALMRLILAEIAREPFDLALAYSSAMTPCLTRLGCPRRVADLVDVDSAKWAAYAREHSPPKRWLYAREARKVAALEQEACRLSDAAVVVTSAEATMLGAGGKVHVVGNGVDCEYFGGDNNGKSKDNDKSEDHGRDARATLVFTGTMNYRPNVQAVCWFVRNVWPELKRQAPELRFVIVGREPTNSVRRLAQTPGVHVTGAVPDVRPYLEAASAAVFPLQISPGIPNKLLEALAAGLAAVASPCVIDGLDLQVGRHLLQARTPDQWRRQILAIIRGEPLRVQLGWQARAHMREHFTWEKQLAPLVTLCRTLCE